MHRSYKEIWAAMTKVLLPTPMISAIIRLYQKKGSESQTMEKLKMLPIGIENFTKIRKDDFYYVVSDE